MGLNGPRHVARPPSPWGPRRAGVSRAQQGGAGGAFWWGDRRARVPAAFRTPQGWERRSERGWAAGSGQRALVCGHPRPPRSTAASRWLRSGGPDRAWSKATIPGRLQSPDTW